MEYKLFVFALLFGLTACAESVPDVTGTYRDKGKYIQRDYEITRLEADPKKFKMVITERWRDNELKKNNVYTYTTQNKFCEESTLSSCFTYDEKQQAIRLDGFENFFPKVN